MGGVSGRREGGGGGEEVITFIKKSLCFHPIKAKQPALVCEHDTLPFTHACTHAHTTTCMDVKHVTYEFQILV